MPSRQFRDRECAEGRQAAPGRSADKETSLDDRRPSVQSRALRTSEAVFPSVRPARELPVLALPRRLPSPSLEVRSDTTPRADRYQELAPPLCCTAPRPARHLRVERGFPPQAV